MAGLLFGTSEPMWLRVFFAAIVAAALFIDLEALCKHGSHVVNTKKWLSGLSLGWWSVWRSTACCGGLCMKKQVPWWQGQGSPMGQVGRGVRPFVLLFVPLGVRAAMSRNGLAVCCASNAAIDGCYALVSIDYLHRPHTFSV